MAKGLIRTPEEQLDLIRASKQFGARTYSLGGREYISVTTIIGRGEPKPVLVNWAKKVTAEYAVEHADMINQMIAEDGPRAAIDFLKGAAYRQRDAKGDIGTRLHESAEMAALGLSVETPDNADEALLVHHLQDFLRVADPEWLAVEAVVYSETHGYAGTLDGIARLRGDLGLKGDLLGPVIVDWKSGSGVYGSHAMQLSAYAWADSIVGAEGHIDLGDLDASTEKAVVVHITASGWKLVEVNIGEEVFTSFLSCIEMAKWTDAGSKRAVGVTLAAGGATGGSSVSLPSKSKKSGSKKKRSAAPLSSGDGTRKRIAPPNLG